MYKENNFPNVGKFTYKRKNAAIIELAAKKMAASVIKAVCKCL
jgi:hypothetical protein